MKLFSMNSASNSSVPKSIQRGFTLLEVMIAMLILAVAMIAIASKVSIAAKVAQRSQSISYGRWVAMNAITEVRLQPGLPATGRSDGDEEMAGQDWRWTMEISETPVEGLRRIDVEVARSEDPDKIAYTMAAFVGENIPPTAVRPWGGLPGQAGNPNGQNPGGITPPQLPGSNNGRVTPPQRPNPRTGLNPN